MRIHGRPLVHGVTDGTQDSLSGRSPPWRSVLPLAVAVAFLLIFVLGLHVYESHSFFGRIGDEFARQTEAVTRLRTLRWDLTEAAHHVVLFGATEDRRAAYADASQRLNAELEAGLEVPPGDPARANLPVLAELARRLGDLEQQAIAAALAGRQAEALAVLHGRDYVAATRTLCNQIDTHAEAVYSRLQERLKSHGQRELVFLSIDVAVLLFAGGLWWLLGLRLRNWRALAEAELSKRIQVEEKLRQAQKMEALGQMAAGVGHDFKNVLSSIQGYADLAVRAAERGQLDAASLRGIQAAAEQGGAVTRALLTFSHNTGPEREPVNLCRLLAETVELLRGTLPASVAIAAHADLPAEQCWTLGDRNQLQQILLNLANNAADAMPAGGRLTMTLSAGEAANPERTPVLCLAVSDTGQGIPPAIRERIFEPFFTTKGRGQSTGLGLAIVQAIAVDHGATIDVASTVGEGTTFRLCFPRDETGASRNPPPALDPQARLLIASADPYQAELLVSAIGRLGLQAERVTDWAGLLDGLARHRQATLTVLLDTDFVDCRAAECRRAFAAAGAEPRVLILTQRGSSAVREYEDAGFMVLERPLPLAELVRLIATGGPRP